MSAAQRHAIPEDDRCLVCDGYGTIWVSWSSGNPVPCGHCHGDGRKPDRSHELYPSASAGSTEE